MSEKEVNSNQATSKVSELDERLADAAAKGSIPDLKGFSMSKEFRDIPLGRDIPKPIFKTISSLFGYILAVEEGKEPKEPK